LQDENVEAIVYHIHGVIGSFMKRLEKEHTSRRISPEKRREEFRALLSDAARPFLLGRTERFVTEVELFLVSNLNMEAYNKLRVQRFRESSSHLTREQDALPHDRSLEEHYLYFVCNDTDCDEMQQSTNLVTKCPCSLVHRLLDSCNFGLAPITSLVQLDADEIQSMD